MRRVPGVTLALCGIVGISSWLALSAQEATPIIVDVPEPIPSGPTKVNHRVIKHDDHPTPSPSAGKALVYVTIGGYFGKASQGKLAVNGEYRAIVEKNQYTFFEVDPGVLKFSYEGGAVPDDSPDAYLVITALPDQTYYVSCERRSIQEVDVEEGESLLPKRRYVSFEVKE